MHELSLAINIVEIAEDSAKQANCNTITSITLDVGTQSGVVVEALEFAMDSAKINSMMENAEIMINEIQAKAKCTDCSTEFEIAQLYDACPKCGSILHDIIEGKELKVKSLDAE